MNLESGRRMRNSRFGERCSSQRMDISFITKRKKKGEGGGVGGGGGEGMRVGGVKNTWAAMVSS